MGISLPKTFKLPRPGGAGSMERVSPADRHAQLRRISLFSSIGAAALLLLFAGVIFGVQYAERGQIRHGVKAFGVDLSGMTRAEARAALLSAAAQRGAKPLRLTDGWRSWEVRGGDLGLSMDVDGAVDDAFAAGRHGWGPSRLALLWHLRDSGESVGDSRVGVIGQMLDEQLSQIASEIDQEKVEPSLSLDPEVGPSYTPAQVGRTLNVEETREKILGALTSGDTSMALVIDEDHPTTTDTDYTEAWQQLTYIFDGPIEVVAAGETWTFQPSDLARWITLSRPKGGEPASVAINEQWVRDVVWEISLSIDRLPRSPRIWWGADGKLVKMQDGLNGQTLRQDDAFNWLKTVFLGKDATNRADLPVDIEQTPPLPADLSTIGIAYPLAEASTPYGGSIPERMHNIELAARLLNGTLIMPGQTFSFNAEIGPMTVDAGFQIAYGIDSTGGNLTTVPSEAGGICQVATTVFQPIFWTGYEILERNTHSYWIETYTSRGYVGLDATVDEPSGLDFRWTNNSQTAVMLETYTDGQNFTARIYGTQPNWTVEVTEPVITNVKHPEQKTIYQPSNSIPNGSMRRIQHASTGFDVSITRRVYEGDHVREAQFVAQYGAVQDLVLVGSDTGELPPDFVPPEE